MSQAVLITGASGFLGQNLTHELLRRPGYAVRAFVETGYAVPGVHPNRLYSGDINDLPLLTRAMEGVHTVYHLASVVKDWGEANHIIRVNTLGTRTVAEAAVKAGVKRLVYVSSLAVHRFVGYFHATEKTPRDNNAYPISMSKIMGEHVVERYWYERKLEVVIVRPGAFIFGPCDYKNFVALVEAIEKGHFAHINGGRAYTCFSYVENLVQGLILAGEHPDAPGNIFCLTDETAVRWKDLISLICRLGDLPPPRVNLPYQLAMVAAGTMEKAYQLARSDDPPLLTRYRVDSIAHNFHFTSKKAKRMLGYAPKISLEEGLARTFTWLDAERTGLPAHHHPVVI